MIFTKQDYDTLSALTFRSDYPGYRPGLIESPNGDGVLDTGKRFSHVAAKYLTRDWYHALQLYLWQAHRAAVGAFRGTPLRPEYAPSFEYGALRILHYPAGVGSATHTDFDLFTINCYRSTGNPGLPACEFHMGELGELLGLGPATPHWVDPLLVPQESIVYFAIPDHAAVLPGGGTVGEWIQERMKRSRYNVQ